MNKKSEKKLEIFSPTTSSESDLQSSLVRQDGKRKRGQSKEDIVFLNQLIRTLEEAELKLEEAYDKKNYENFNNIKKLIMRIQERISGVVR